MNIRTSAFRGLAILSLSVLGLAACDEKETVTPPPAPEVTITVTPTQLNLEVGQSGDLVAIIGNSTNQTVTWQSSNTTVATVSATGRVTAVAPGSAVITATSAADPTKRAAAGVSVTAAPPPPVITVSVAPSAASVNIGGTVQLVPTVTGHTNQNVTYTSSAPSVATVNASGLVTAVAAGTTIITVRSAQDNSKVATAQITVLPSAPITVQITPSQATTQVNGTVQFVATVAGSSNQNVTWASSAPGVATITAGGLATGVSAGTAVITATSAANNQAVATAVLTVTALPPVTLSVTPTTITNLGAGASTQIVATVTGSTNQNVTCSSADAAVATVAVSATGRGCNVTGVAAGSTVITVASAADPSVTQSVLVTVVGASVAIANIPASPAAGPFVINANVSVPAGTADFLDIILTNTATGTQYRVRCQTFTAAGAATTVTCPINPADIDPNTAGAQVLPNGTYTIRAELLKGNNVAATATFGQQLTTANNNTVAGTITFNNSLVDNDNIADAETDVDAAGNVWYGGAITVTLAPSIYQGNALNTVEVVVDLNCNAADDGAGEPSRTVTIGADGTGSVTFSEAATMAAATPGVDNLEQAGVCFALVNPRDASNVTVQLAAAGAGTGNVITAGTVVNPIPGNGQNQYNIDNVEPVAPGAAIAFDAADFDGLSTNLYLGQNSSVTATGANPTVLNVCSVAACAAGSDLGVGGVTVTYYAVPAASFDATSQTTLRNSAAAGTAFTSPTQLAEASAGTDYVLVVEVRDRLGNRRFIGNAATASFGVDLTPPTISVVAASSAPADAINPATMNWRLAVTDQIAGGEGISGTLVGYSVFETDADTGTETRCYTFGGVNVALPASGVCATQTQTTVVATVGVTTEHYDVTIPALPTENFYVLTVQAYDAAGNMSTETITRQALLDVTAGPDAGTGMAVVSINSYTIDNVNNTATVNGVVRDNIEVAFSDARFLFPGLVDRNAVDVPDAVPFTTPSAVGTYGLPLTGAQTTSATTQVNVDAIHVTPAGGSITPTQFGFGMLDIAGNFAFGGVAIPAGATNGFAAGFTAFDAATSAAIIDRTPPAGGTTTTTLTARATTGPADANPFVGGQVYFYYVNPGGDFAYGTADDSNVLIGVVPAGTTAIATGETARTYTWSQSLTAFNVPVLPAGFALRTFAVAVAADGDAVMTDVVNVTVNQ